MSQVAKETPGKSRFQVSIRLQQVLAMVKEAGFIEGIKILSHLSIDALLVMLTGGFILAVPLGIGTYFFSYRFFDHIQKIPNYCL